MFILDIMYSVKVVSWTIIELKETFSYVFS